MTLEEQIEESRRKLRERRPPEPRSRESLNTLAVSRIDDSLPEALREFVVYIGEYPEAPEDPETWIPRMFKIETPRLAPISFTTVEIEGSTLVHVISIRVDEARFTDWDDAIVAAAGPESPRLGGRK